MTFAIGIRYLCGWAMATHPTDRESPEWPPHPDRVFMALAAAYFETDGTSDERAALEWLEGLREPCAIIASFGPDHAKTRTAVTAYVPVNDTEMGKDGLRLLPEFRSRQARQFPATVPADDTVHLVWDAKEEAGEHLARLDELSRRVTYLGHSASLVQMWIERDFPITPDGSDAANDIVPAMARERLVPTTGRADRRVRISGPGRVADLEARFNHVAVEQFRELQAALATAKGKKRTELKQRLESEFGGQPPLVRRPQPALWQGYVKAVSPKPMSDSCNTVFDSDLIVLRCLFEADGGEQRLGLETTLQLTEALRNTAMKHCSVQPPPEWFSGHKLGSGQESSGPPSELPHLAFIPLPHIGRRYADGHLLGCAIVVPRRVENAEMGRCLEQLFFGDDGLPRPLTLVMPRIGQCRVELDERDDRPVALRPETWTSATPAKASALWATVTPIVFDRHPKTKFPASDSAMLSERARAQAAQAAETEEMIRVACERIGLPRPSGVWIEPTSRFIGVPHARRFPVMQRKTGGNLHHTHAVIEFSERLVGPVLLGAGRYRGYGLCRPIPSRSSMADSEEGSHE